MLLLWRSRSSTLTVSVFAALIFLYLITGLSRHSGNDPSNFAFQSILHLLIPAEGSNVNLCKTVLSATLLGYPVPTFVNWNTKDGSKTRISKVLEYLNRLSDEEAGDLVLIADGYEYWFQLSPQILIDRYHELNLWANQGIKQKAGNEDNKPIIRQAVVFNSRKKCWPFAPDDDNCSEAAVLPYPPALYQSNETANQNVGKRETYLDSSFILGPAGGLRLIFERANAKRMSSSDANLTDQAIFTSIWGEQEYQRISVLEPSLPGSALQILDKAFAPNPNQNYEFAIGLDYTNAIFPPPVVDATNPEYPLDFINFANETILTQVYKARKIHPMPDPLPQLHEDVAADNLPFSVLAGSVAYSEPQKWYLGPSSTKWQHAPLYTDLWTGITPVIIPQTPPTSSSSYETDETSRPIIEDPWRSMWFRPLARKLLEGVLAAKEGPIAVEGQHGDGRKWYGPISRSKFAKKDGFGVKLDGKGGGLFGFCNVCEGEELQQQIFGDGLGTWKWDSENLGAKKEKG